MSVVTAIHPDVVRPPRYDIPWREGFEREIESRLREGTTILDVGSGRNSTIDPASRPVGARYVGLDLSRDELLAAGPGVYDEIVEADLVTPVPSLVGTIDLAVSWQVFEHVRSLDLALDNLHSYLKPGGSLISLFSGKWSVFGLLNQVLPNAVGTRIVERSMRRRNTDQPVFPAYYHRCYDGALRDMTTQWSAVTIYPLYQAANYFHFSRRLSQAYLAYENTAHARRWNNLATHYLLVAER